jgi:hypothetical protein
MCDAVLIIPSERRKDRHRAGAAELRRGDCWKHDRMPRQRSVRLTTYGLNIFREETSWLAVRAEAKRLCTGWTP